MSSITFREMQKLLQDRGTALQIDFDGLERATLGTDADSVGGQSVSPGQMAELASDASKKAVMYDRMDSAIGELREIGEALARLENGTFGSCETCDQHIPLERLQAIPYARLCIHCKSAEELQQAERPMA